MISMGAVEISGVILAAVLVATWARYRLSSSVIVLFGAALLLASAIEYCAMGVGDANLGTLGTSTWAFFALSTGIALMILESLYDERRIARGESVPERLSIGALAAQLRATLRRSG